MHIQMKKSIIAFKTPTNINIYIARPFWYKCWREGRCTKRLGYYTTTHKNGAHKFTKRRNVRLIMNDIALRYKRKPTLIQCQNQ